MNTRIPDIRFYDFEFKLLHVENQFTSSNWSICYNDIGTFEAHFDIESDTLPFIINNDYLVAVQGDLSAIIVGKNLGSDLTIYGRTCNWLLTKRVIDAFAQTSGSISVLVPEKVRTAFSDVPFYLGTALTGLPLLTAERSDKCEAFSFVKESLDLANLGHRVDFKIAEKRWVFEMIKGNEDNPLVISAANRNAYDVVMDGDLLALCTEGWYKEKQDNNTTEWKKAEKLSILEKYRTEIYRWEELLPGGSKSEAEAALNKARVTDSIQGKTIGLCFGRDYSLGDTVAVEWQSGQYKKRVEKRIIGVNLWYESGNIGEEPMFEDIE